ncbi:MAG: penicillin-binding protein 2, partial [Bacteroidales bacterium]|nr:penicillin-binding protein 2 [Bacteroidales bacterium]
MSIKKDIVWRVAVIYFSILFFALLIIGRVFYLQFFESEKWKSKSEMISYQDVTIEPNRGDIYSNDGRLLATSVPFYEVRMDLNSNALNSDLFYEKVDSLALCLSYLFKDRSQNEYRRLLILNKNKGNRYFLIQKHVTYTQLKKLRNFPIFRLGRYKGGLIIEQTNKRIMPHLNLAARTIGYISEGGAVGLEGAYDKYLRGVVGVKLMQKLSGGVWMPIDDKNAIEPQNGKDIITTIDINFQDVAEQALLKQLLKVDAIHGCAVLMEVETGDIKAISNLKRNSDGTYSELYNFAIGESTEPGSTFKLASLIVALEDKHIDLDDTVQTGNGEIEYYGIKLTDSKEGGYGKITIKEAFEYSSNVGISKVITKYYGKNERKFIDRLYSMNLNEKLGMEIKGEGDPLIKYPSDPTWSGISLPWMSIGYELRLTPLQILTFYNAIANDGKMIKPRFVKGIMEHGEITRSFKMEVINHSICSKQTIIKVKELLEGVVENGTAQNLKNPNYKIAGKTGTAQIANKKYGYNHDKGVSYQASFVGYFPADNPKYSCIVVVNSPSRYIYYGNIVAGPVFKEIADKVYATSPELNINGEVQY